MQLSNLDLKQICSAFDNAQTIGINYSWLGTPSCSFTANGQEYSDSLAGLETKVENLIRSKHESRTPEAYIETAYVVDKFSQLKERSQKEIDQANCVTRIFYRLREALAKFSLKIIPDIYDDINLFKNCYISIPIAIAQQNGFMTRFPAPSTDSFSGEPLYTQSQALQIYRQLPRN